MGLCPAVASRKDQAVLALQEFVVPGSIQVVFRDGLRRTGGCSPVSGARDPVSCTTGSACGWHGGTRSLSNTLAFVSVPQAGSPR